MLIPLLLLLNCTVLIVALLSIRLLLVIHRLHARASPPPRRARDAPASLAVFLGSGECETSRDIRQSLNDRLALTGGHTAEMLRLVSGLDWRRYSKRTWIISSGDQLSESKALELEKKIGSGSVSGAPSERLESADLGVRFAVHRRSHSPGSSSTPILPHFALHYSLLFRLLFMAHHSRTSVGSAPNLRRPDPLERPGQLCTDCHCSFSAQGEISVALTIHRHIG